MDYRKDFPALENGFVYLNNASTTYVPTNVIDAMSNYYKEIGANYGRGIDSLGYKVVTEVEKTRENIASFIHAKKDEMQVKLYGDKGGAEIEPELQIVSEKHNTILNVTPQVDHLSFNFTQAFQAEIDHFIECIIENKETISPVQDGVEMMKILCGIYESSATGKEITF